MPRSNRIRTEQTRSDLLAAARKLFTEQGYNDTATPDIVAAAGVTRGALYHHFEDKKALFRAVVEREAQAVADTIDAGSSATTDARAALIEGGKAFLAAMAEPGRTRLLLLDGPAVLGRAEMDAIDARNGARTLHEGLADAVRQGAMPDDLPLEAITALLSAAFDRAALTIDAGANEAVYAQALERLVSSLFAPR